MAKVEDSDQTAHLRSLIRDFDFRNLIMYFLSLDILNSYTCRANISIIIIIIISDNVT